MEQLLNARPAKPHDRDVPKCDSCPILVLRLFGMNFIIDGGTRMNRRIRDNDLGPHAVVVIEYSAPV